MCESLWLRQILFAAVILSFSNLLAQFAIETVHADDTDDSRPGYLESARVTNAFRLRFDAGFDANRPDRAEYFYGTWRNILDHPHAIKGTDQIISGVNNRGTILLAESVDFQEISAYLELAHEDKASVFAELPLRFLTLIGDAEFPGAFTTREFRDAYNAAEASGKRSPQGVSDLQVGFKYGMLDDPDMLLTLQFRTYIPTGNSFDGLGTGHVSFEPALLSQTRLTEKLWMMGQSKLWTPIDGGANAGNIAIYGLGLGYNLIDKPISRPGGRTRFLRIVPLAEFAGWTVLDGFETLSSNTGEKIVPNDAHFSFDPDLINDRDPPQTAGQVHPNRTDGQRVGAPREHGVRNAAGATIVNMKLGIRTSFNEQNSLYIGWGRSLTGHRWYKDFARIELLRTF